MVHKPGGRPAVRERGFERGERQPRIERWLIA
jgi:hypothetical protein